MKNIGRRSFLKKTSLSAAAFATTPLIPSCKDSNIKVPISSGKYMGDFTATKLEKVRIAFIGVGHRGVGHLKYLVNISAASHLKIVTIKQAIVSSLASMLNSTSTIFTMDIYKQLIDKEA